MLEPIILPKLLIHFADFPYMNSNLYIGLLTLKTWCGLRYEIKSIIFIYYKKISSLYDTLLIYYHFQNLMKIYSYNVIITLPFNSFTYEF